MFLPRSRTDYNATIICPDGKEIVIPIESSFDMVKGLYLPILYTISSFGWGILQAFPSSVIDYYSDNAYSVNEIILSIRFLKNDKVDGIGQLPEQPYICVAPLRFSHT